MSKKIYLILICLFIVLPAVANGAGFGGIPNPLGTDSFAELFVRIINWMAGIATTLAVLMVVVGGVQYMISGGNEDKIKAARKTIQWALIGLIVVLMSWGLLKELLDLLGVGSGPSS